MHVVRRDHLHIVLLCSTCIACVTCAIARPPSSTDPPPPNSKEVLDSDQFAPIARNLWHCVDGNKTWTCFGDLIVNEVQNSSLGHQRGMKQKLMDVAPYLLAPAFMLAGVMPWVMPPLKMMVMFVVMLNNMAFSSALISLVRNYVFNRRQEEHIFYINHGYQNHTMHR